LSLDLLCQAIIAGSGPLGLWMVNSKRPWPMRGYVLILFGQVFWLIASWRSRQWGIFVVSIFWTAAWIRGACREL
jgi:hypothetical protein